MNLLGEVVCFLMVIALCRCQWLVLNPQEDMFIPDEPNPVYVSLMHADPGHNIYADPLGLGRESPSYDDPSPDLSLETLNNKIDRLMSEQKLQEDKIAKLEETNKKLEVKVELIEQQVKTNNLIFYNVTDNKKESYKYTLQKVLSILNRFLKVRTHSNEISVALRADLANNDTDSKHRIIVVKFANFDTKMKVLAARSKLSHTNIWISPDYSEQVTKTRAQLFPFLLEARRQGRNAFMLYDKLVVDGIKKTLAELQAEATESVEPEEEVLELEETTQYPDATLPEEPDDQVEEVYVEPEIQDREESSSESDVYDTYLRRFLKSSVKQ